MKKTITILGFALVLLLGQRATCMAKTTLYPENLIILEFNGNKSDGANTYIAEDVPINQTYLNDFAPVITVGQVFHLTEQSPNGTTVGTVIATDADVTPTTYQNWTITAGNSGGYFAINPFTGVITVVDNTGLNPAINPTYTLTLTVSDGVNTSLPQTISIIVAEINDDNPVVTASQSFSVNENAANSTVVGQVLATDPDYGTVFQGWNINSGNTGNAFAINSVTGEITVNNSSVLDYENVTSFSLNIQVSDGLHTASGVVTVTLNNVNEVPYDIALSASSINENVAGNTTVGTLSTSDVDVADTFTYSLVAGTGDADNASFNINLNNLRITSSPNYELKNTYTVRVRTTDQGGLTYEEAFIITINDIDEVPVLTTQAVSNVSTNAATGNGTIADLGSPNPTQYGVCWNTTGTPTINDNYTTLGAVSTTGAYTSSMTSLNDNTIYYVRAYATNTAGTSYGNEVSFTTVAVPRTIAFDTTSSNGFESVSSANLQVNLSEVSSQDVTVDYTVTGTATGNGVDYTLADGTLTISAGNINNNITITNIVDDLLVEGDETIIVTLSNPINATLGANTVHTYTINDNTTNISEILKSNISIYPNPFTSNIYFNNISSNISFIYINDLLGKTLLKRNYFGDKCLNMSDLTSGVYLLIIEFDNGEKQIIKLVKE